MGMAFMDARFMGIICAEWGAGYRKSVRGVGRGFSCSYLFLRRQNHGVAEVEGE